MSTNQLLYAFENQDIKKRINSRSIVIALVLLLAGFGVFGLLPADPGSNLDILRICAGVFLVVMALFFLTFRLTHLVYVPTSSEVLKKSVSYDTGDFIGLKAGLGKFVDVSGIRMVDDKSPVRMDCFHSRDGRYIAFQLFQYASYLDQPISAVFHLKDEAARRLMDMMDKK